VIVSVEAEDTYGVGSHGPDLRGDVSHGATRNPGVTGPPQHGWSARRTKLPITTVALVVGWQDGDAPKATCVICRRRQQMLMVWLLPSVVIVSMPPRNRILAKFDADHNGRRFICVVHAASASVSVQLINPVVAIRPPCRALARWACQTEHAAGPRHLPL
jgi:hypothetical protein